MKLPVTITKHEQADVSIPAIITALREHFLNGKTVRDGKICEYRKTSANNEAWVPLYEATFEECAIYDALSVLSAMDK